MKRTNRKRRTNRKSGFKILHKIMEYNEGFSHEDFENYNVYGNGSYIEYGSYIDFGDVKLSRISKDKILDEDEIFIKIYVNEYEYSDGTYNDEIIFVRFEVDKEDETVKDVDVYDLNYNHITNGTGDFMKISELDEENIYKLVDK